MKFSEIRNQFKNYALYERGMAVNSYKETIASMEKFVDFAKTDNLKKLDEWIAREFLHVQGAERAWAPKTFRNQRQYLKGFFDWCVKRGFVAKNPAENIEKPKLPKRLPRCLTKEQTTTVLAHIRWHEWRYKFEGIRNEAIIMTFLFTGLRLRELLNLEVLDVNLEDETIFVRKGKGSKDRIVPIHPRLLPVLRGYVSEHKKQGGASRWFFTGIKSDKRLGAKNVQEICRKISMASGIKFTPHMLRHTFGRLATDGDLNLYKLKEIMGHSDVSTTQIYLSVSKNSLKESFSKICLF